VTPEDSDAVIEQQREAGRWTAQPTSSMPPPLPSAPSAPARRRRPPIRLIIFAALLLFGVFGYFMSRRPLDAPDQLAGLARSTDTALVADAEKAQSDAKDDLGGNSTVAAYYGTQSNAILLIAGREKLDLDEQWTSFEKDAGKSIPHSKINGVECSTAEAGAVVCVSSGDVSIVLYDFRAGSTVEQAAAATNEAKKALN